MGSRLRRRRQLLLLLLLLPMQLLVVLLLVLAEQPLLRLALGPLEHLADGALQPVDGRDRLAEAGQPLQRAQGRLEPPGPLPPLQG